LDQQFDNSIKLSLQGDEN